MILFLTCVPYWIVAWATPKGWQFSGLLVIPPDGHTYLSKMRQGWAGHWLFHMAYTPEPHREVFIYTYYLLLGHLARLFHLPLVGMFHLARLIGGFALLAVLYRFLARLLPKVDERRLAFILIAATSGLGWLGMVFLHTIPIDIAVPEALVPFSLFANPHFPLATALMLVLLEQVGWPRRSPFSIGWVGLTAVALAITLPFALGVVEVLLTVFLVWLSLARRAIPWPQLGRFAALFFSSAPFLAYDAWLTRTHPVIAGWSAQNLTPAPSLLDLGLGYGLAGVGALLGAERVVRRGIRRTPPGEMLVFLWALVAIGLVFSPFSLQRRFLHGLHIPLGVLATLGLKRDGAPSFLARYRSLVTKGVVALGIGGTLFTWGLHLGSALLPPDRSAMAAQHFFIRQEEATALAWLEQHATEEEVVLASPRVGLLIPSQTGARAFYGHSRETLDAENKKALAEAFFRGEIESVSPPPHFIFYGPSERTLGRPQGLDRYPLLFATKQVQIYRYVPPVGAPQRDAPTNAQF
jgi:hypothetical protein